MVLVKNWPFFHFIILGLVGQENFFYDIVQRKKPFFRLQKTKSRKVKKLRFFQKGLTMVFVRNLPFFYCFILDPAGQENVFYDIFERKHSFLGYKNKKLKKSKKLRFSLRRQIKVFVKHYPFFYFIILGLVGQENVFYHILERKKKHFQAIKTKSLRSRKN